MKRALGAVAASFGYFSVLPIGRGARAGPPDGAALVALPIVGATLGALGGTAGLAASRWLPRPVAGACGFAVVVVLSGAVHLDGFLDGCDAFFASVPPERRLEILKDPHHGTFALAGLAVVAMIWQASLRALPARRLPAACAFAGALARAVVIPCAFAFPDARSDGSRAAFSMRHAALPLALQLALLMLWGARLVPRAPLLVPLSLAVAFAIEAWCSRQLGGGLVGDAYGFAIVVLELAILAVLVAELA